jgi:hypothetical protein
LMLRHFFDFFLTPPGRYTVSPPFPEHAKPLEGSIACYAVSENLLLAVRCSVIVDEAMSQWQPNSELLLLPSNKEG